MKKLTFLLLAISFNLSAFDEWDRCDSCSNYQKKQLAKKHYVKTDTDIHILDKTQKSVTTYHIFSDYVETGDFKFELKTFADLKTSPIQAIEAKDYVFSFTTLNNNWRLTSEDLGIEYHTAGYLVNAGNAADVALAINQNADFASTEILRSGNELIKGAIEIGLDDIEVELNFPDGSKAFFKLVAAKAITNNSGFVIEIKYGFELALLVDKNSKVLPRSRGDLVGRSFTATHDTIGTWQTAFNVLGVDWSFENNEGNDTGSFPTSCRMGADDKVVCTIIRSE